MFYYIEAVVLLEDFIESVDTINTTNFKDGPVTYFSEVSYYNSSDVTAAYHRAAL